MIAALYVQTGGAYFGLEGVDPWDIERDARLYAGPHPVVAHPPCNRWSQPLAQVNQTRYGHMVGDDGGTFKHALESVRRFGGVLEHPANTAAWKAFHLPRPERGRWVPDLFDKGWTTEVSQVAYGCPMRKRTWLYWCGPGEPPALDWSEPEHTHVCSHMAMAGGVTPGSAKPVLTQRAASATPPLFRALLLSLAR